MANFNGFILTNNGKKLLEKALTGKKLIFTKFQFGNGESYEDIKEISHLANMKKEVTINQIENTGNGQVMLRVISDNKDTEDGYYIREIGVFARCDDGEELLYAYNKAIEADYLPIYNGKNLVEIEYANYITVAQINDVEAIIDGNITYLTKAEADGKFVKQTQIATSEKEGIISELRVKEISKEKINDSKAEYDFINRKFLDGVIHTNNWDTNISAHLNFHRSDLKGQNWWEEVPENLKSYGWDLRLYSSLDGSHLGVHKIRDNKMYGLLDTSLIWSGDTVNYLNNNGGSKLVTCNQHDTFVTDNLVCFNGRDTSKRLGIFHYSSTGAPYHQGPRTNWNYSRLLDEIDKVDFDNRFNDLFNKHNNHTVWDLRLTGAITAIIWTKNEATERNGYVLTGLINWNSDEYIDFVQMRALQMFRAGNWYNVPFA